MSVIKEVSAAGEDCYLALDKGAITDQHVLVLPVEHYPSSLSLAPPVWEEMERCGGSRRPCLVVGGWEGQGCGAAGIWGVCVGERVLRVCSGVFDLSLLQAGGVGVSWQGYGAAGGLN